MGTSFEGKIIWHDEILPRQTKKALEFLSKQTWVKRSFWYLAGGTALALQTGHRSSVDLDFFTSQDGFNNANLLKHFLKNQNWQTSINSEGTIYGELFRAKVSFIAYPFFKPSQQSDYYGTIRVLSPTDIAVMKIIAISQRGRKRDFFDLYWCANNLEPLEKTILRLKKQYPKVAHDYHHILKSLVYFADAENDPMPRINFNASWLTVKKFFIKEVPKITNKIIGLTP
mgnify:CR=1 FL=1